MLGAFKLCLGVSVTYYAITGTPADRAAWGGRVRPGVTCAISRDLAHLAGQSIEIDGIGRRVINDKMGAGPRLSVDVAVSTASEARRLGRQRAVKICLQNGK